LSRCSRFRRIAYLMSCTKFSGSNLFPCDEFRIPWPTISGWMAKCWEALSRWGSSVSQYLFLSEIVGQGMWNGNIAILNLIRECRIRIWKGNGSTDLSN
jgi:hypothetical protein